ncbi:MAG: fibronectin type III domain-containing protein, partial [Candidatus Nanopelagicales bacterium]
PAAPIITAVTPGDSSLSVTFTAGSANGSAITNYEYSVDGGTTWVARGPAATTSPVVVTGLTNGTTYPVMLRAVNSVGASSASDSVSGTPAAVSPPPVQGPAAPAVPVLTLESLSTVAASIVPSAHTTGISFRTKGYSAKEYSPWQDSPAVSKVNVPVKMRKGTWVQFRATGPGGVSRPVTTLTRVAGIAITTRGDLNRCKMPTVTSVTYPRSQKAKLAIARLSTCQQWRVSVNNSKKYSAWKSVRSAKLASPKLTVGKSGRIQIRAGNRTATVWLYQPH